MHFSVSLDTDVHFCVSLDTDVHFSVSLDTDVHFSVFHLTLISAVFALTLFWLSTVNFYLFAVVYAFLMKNKR